MTTTRDRQSTTAVDHLHLAVVLGWSEWKLTLTFGPDRPPRPPSGRAAAIGAAMRSAGVSG